MRKLFRKIHKWLSLPVGIIISITCLSGAILVFQDEIQKLAHPERYYVKEIKEKVIPIEELVPMINRQLKDNSVASVRIESDPKSTYTMGLKDGFRISAYADPYTGELTGIYEFRESPFFTVMSIHRWLLDGSRTWGKYTVGIATILFAFILISGFIIWLPREFKKSRFKIQWRKGRKRLFFDLHNVLGAYACLVLLICALTGLMWSFEWYRNGVFKIFGAEVPQEQGHGGQRGGSRDKKEAKELNVSQWQDIFHTLETQNPNYEYIRIEESSAAVHHKSAPTSRATDQYKFDNEKGDIKEIKLYADQEKISKIWGWAYALHVGNYWGIWSKIFTFIFALVGASLPITGYYIFFIKRRKKPKRKV